MDARAWTLRVTTVTLVSVALVSTALVSARPVTAKDFGPGDARVCDAAGCEPIMKRGAARELASFLYAGPQPEHVWHPPSGSPSFELRLRRGRTVGDVGGRWLNRMRVPTLNCDRFSGRGWYRLPSGLARELRALTEGRSAMPLGPPPRRTC